MKTIWHWGNLGKFAVTLVGTAVGWTLIVWLFSLPIRASILIGFILGFACNILCQIRWEMWHFEFTDTDYKYNPHSYGDGPL